jgi:hypothetical protein
MFGIQRINIKLCSINYGFFWFLNVHQGSIFLGPTAAQCVSGGATYRYGAGICCTKKSATGMPFFSFLIKICKHVKHLMIRIPDKTT